MVSVELRTAHHAHSVFTHIIDALLEANEESDEELAANKVEVDAKFEEFLKGVLMRSITPTYEEDVADKHEREAQEELPF